MKRIVLPILLLLLLFSSCAGESKRAYPNCIIDDSVRIRYMQCDFTAHIKTEQTGKLTALIENPDTIKGITVVCDEDGMTVKCGDLEIEPNGGYLPFSMLYEVLKTANASEPVSVKENGEKIIFQYDDFSIETDSETKKIEHIDAKNCVYEMR